MKYKYSIVIPTYRRFESLLKAIKSAQGQSYISDYEILVCDNHSDYSPEEIEILRSLNINLSINESNIGMIPNWNACINKCKGQWIVLLHDDDLMMSNFLKTTDELLNRLDKKTVGLFNIPNKMDNNQVYINKNRSNKITEIKKMYFVCSNLPSPCCSVFKKEKALECGGFNQEYYPSADYEFWSRLIEYGKCYIHDIHVSNYNIYQNTSSLMETSINFVVQNYYIRKELYRYSGPVAKRMIYLDIVEISNRWSNSINVDEVENKIGFKIKKRLMLGRIIRKAILLQLYIKGFFSEV